MRTTVGPVFFGPDNRAGQILAFHPGEQVHRGMGYDGRSTHAYRLVSVLRAERDLKLFSSEYAWGLVRKGVTLHGISEHSKNKKKCGCG